MSQSKLYPDRFIISNSEYKSMFQVVFLKTAKIDPMSSQMFFILAFTPKYGWWAQQREKRNGATIFLQWFASAYFVVSPLVHGFFATIF